MQAKKKYEQSSDMVWRQIGEETILVPINREVGNLNNVFTLNDTAAFIWSMIDGEKSLGEIRDALVAEYEVDPEKAEQDLDQCIAQLEELKGIRETG
ncbi:MAG: PqqD family protein [Thermoleophilia bacterium]